MNATPSSSYTAFQGQRRLATGPLQAVALAVKRAMEQDAHGSVGIFDNSSGRSIDIDVRGSDDEVVGRLAKAAAIDKHAVAVHTGADSEEPRGRGRPKLGVIAREVTLLPRHWEWLSAQPGGASVALRKLVEQARLTLGERDKTRKAHERAYYFMSAMAGDMPGFEEASRALFANDMIAFNQRIASWPSDVRDHAAWIADDSDVSSAND